MAKKNEPRKPWQDMTFRELDNQALIEHAQSLGRKKAVERRLKSIEDQNEGRRSVQLCRPQTLPFSNCGYYFTRNDQKSLAHDAA